MNQTDEKGFHRREPSTDHLTEVDKMIKKYRINVRTHEIEWFTFICYHPSDKNYLIVIDMYEMPQRMYFKRWDEMTCTDYEQIKKEYVEYLTGLINIMKNKEQ